MFKVGFAKIDLEDALLPKQPIREPIEAVSLYVEDGSTSCIWSVLDFMDFNLLVVNSIRSAIHEKTAIPLEHIHVLTTHNHGGGEPNAEILAHLTADCAMAAMGCAKEAKVRYAFTKTDKKVNIKRRLYIPEISGTATVFFGVSEKCSFESALFAEAVIKGLEEGKTVNLPGKSFTKSRGEFSEGDREICAIEFATPEGETIGTLTRFAAHAVCANRPGSFSSDYPYHVRRKMEELCGGVAMFMNGPCAEIAPAMEDKQEGRERVLGEYIACLAKRAVEEKEFFTPDKITDEIVEVPLPVRDEVLKNFVDISDEMPESLPERKAYLDRKRLCGTLGFLREKYELGESELSDTVKVSLGVLKLGELTIFAMPGESFSETAMAIKETLGGDICTVTEHGRTVMYIPTEEEFHLGGYESSCKLTAKNAEAILRYESINALKRIKNK